MGQLYHCFYKEPQGDSILASCFRDVNGVEKQYLFAATHLSKSLAFAFSYHDHEVAMNSAINGTEHEIVVLCGGQKTLDKQRHIRVYAFADDGFEILPQGRQAVSEKPMPFSQAELILETDNINDLMRNNLQVVLLPNDISSYEIRDGETFIPERYFHTTQSYGDFVTALAQDLGARWINHERGINPCAEILSAWDDKKTPPAPFPAP